jgi:hypothetical protein
MPKPTSDAVTVSPLRRSCSLSAELNRLEEVANLHALEPGVDPLKRVYIAEQQLRHMLAPLAHRVQRRRVHHIVALGEGAEGPQIGEPLPEGAEGVLHRTRHHDRQHPGQRRRLAPRKLGRRRRQVEVAGKAKARYRDPLLQPAAPDRRNGGIYRPASERSDGLGVAPEGGEEALPRRLAHQ